jgi:serine kinase of HPr protein (carbohydrate metabolism regulator)
LLREERLWGIPTVLCFLSRGDHSLHAASVEHGGRAIVFGAPGRFGKTTLAAALVGAGYRLLSEDSTCLRRSADDVVVVPGPAMLRVRRNPDRTVEVPGGRVLQVDERVHLAIEPQLRGTGGPVPADAIVLLRESADGQPRLERVAPEEAIPDLWALSFSTPTDEDRRRCFDGVTSLAARVPIWNLHRPLRYDVLDAVIRELEQVPSR